MSKFKTLITIQIKLLILDTKITGDTDKLVSWFVQTPPAKIDRFITGKSVFVIIQNDVLYRGGGGGCLYASLSESPDIFAWYINSFKRD